MLGGHIQASPSAALCADVGSSRRLAVGRLPGHSIGRIDITRDYVESFVMPLGHHRQNSAGFCNRSFLCRRLIRGEYHPQVPS